MKLAIGSDHAGVELKQQIIEKFTDIEFIDVGTNSTESCDYPDYIKLVGEKIQNKEVERGIAICGTGIGASMVANKMKGIRASLCFNEYMAEMSRSHNDSNCLTLGGRIIPLDEALLIVKTWLNTPFEAGRHQVRLRKIHAIEQQNFKS